MILTKKYETLREENYYYTNFSIEYLHLVYKGRLPKKNPTNLGFWLNLRWVGARRGSRCPTPLNRFSFIALNSSK